MHSYIQNIFFLSGIGFMILLITSSIVLTEAPRSLFDDLLAGQVRSEVNDGSSNCWPGESSRRSSTCPDDGKQPAEGKPNVRRPSLQPRTSSRDSPKSSLFGDSTKQSSSLLDSQEPSFLENPQRREVASSLPEPSENQERKDSSESLFDKYMNSERSGERVHSSSRSFEQKPSSVHSSSRSASRQINNPTKDDTYDDIDLNLRILEKEKEALENLPETIWEKALEVGSLTLS